MQDKRYYWLKLKEDFFDDDTMAWIEEQPNGKEYVLFYLKLCLKSLKTNGCLMRSIGQMNIPYDAKQLAKLTNMDFDTVAVAMELFKKIGLVEVHDDGEICMPQITEMTGSETSKAAIMRKSRQKQHAVSTDNSDTPLLPDNGNNVTATLPETSNNVDTEIEYRVRDRDREIEGECERETDIPESGKSDTPAASVASKAKEKKVSYGDYGHVRLTPSEHERLINDYGEKTIVGYIKKMDDWIQLKYANRKKPYQDYNLALRNWLNKDGIRKGDHDGKNRRIDDGLM